MGWSVSSHSTVQRANLWDKIALANRISLITLTTWGCTALSGFLKQPLQNAALHPVIFYCSPEWHKTHVQTHLHVYKHKWAPNDFWMGASLFLLQRQVKSDWLSLGKNFSPLQPDSKSLNSTGGLELSLVWHKSCRYLNALFCSSF